MEQLANLLHVFPVPGFVEVRTKPEALGVLNEPSISWCVYLDRAVGVFRIDGIATDIEVQSATSKVWTVVDRKTCAAGVG